MTTKNLRALYASIRRAANRLYKRGAATPHPGFKPEWKNRVTLAVTFEPESNRDIWKMTFNYVGERDIQCLVGDRDFPLHTTIVEGGLEEVVKPVRFPIVFRALKTSTEACLGDVEIPFNHMIDDGRGTIFLASDKIPTVFADVRKVARSVLNESGFAPLPLDIMHCTVIRITDPKFAEKTGMHSEIREQIARDNERLHRDPIVAKINGVVLDQTHHFLTEGPTTIPRPPKN